MVTGRVTESRTTIFYMAGFGLFVIMSYVFIVAPLKEQQKCVIRMNYAGEVQAGELLPAQTGISKEVKYEQVER